MSDPPRPLELALAGIVAHSYSLCHARPDRHLRSLAVLLRVERRVLLLLEMLRNCSCVCWLAAAHTLPRTSPALLILPDLAYGQAHNRGTGGSN